jgi:hypothetical protein
VLFHFSDATFEYHDLVEFRYHAVDTPSLVIQNAAVVMDEIIWKIADFIGGDK